MESENLGDVGTLSTRRILRHCIDGSKAAPRVACRRHTASATLMAISVATIRLGQQSSGSSRYPMTKCMSITGEGRVS